MTASEAAEYLRCSVSSVQAWISSGELEVDANGQIGNDSIEALLEARSIRKLRKKDDCLRGIDGLFDLDHVGFIYFLLDMGTVVYVGSSESGPGGRVRAHRRQRLRFSAVRFLIVPLTGLALVQEEHRYILRFKPKYNKQVWPWCEKQPPTI